MSSFCDETACKVDKIAAWLSDSFLRVSLSVFLIFELKDDISSEVLLPTPDICFLISKFIDLSCDCDDL